jgi:hypothetical protein
VIRRCAATVTTATAMSRVTSAAAYFMIRRGGYGWWAW